MQFNIPPHIKSFDDDYVIQRSITPDDFLRLAAKTSDPIPKLPFDPSRVQHWDDWPKLIIDPEDRQVFGHEGRHRVAALAHSGFVEIEILVEITPNPVRFNCDLDAMAQWEWNGMLPKWCDLKSEDSWLGLNN